MRWIFKAPLLLSALLAAGYVVAVAYTRWRDTWSGSLAIAAPAGVDPARAVALGRPTLVTSGNGERVFVIASTLRDDVRSDVPRPPESMILVCPRGEAAEETARVLRDYGFFDVRIVPGAAAAEAEPRRRASDHPRSLGTIRLAAQCAEWRPFAL